MKREKQGGTRMAQLGYTRVDAWLTEEDLTALEDFLAEQPYKRSQFVRYAIKKALKDARKERPERREVERA